jgi:sec-independent protein translocase protein TatA
MPGPSEWLIIGLIVVLLVGAKKLPEIARSLGRSSSEFKKGIKEGNEGTGEESTPPASAGPTAAASPPGPAPDGDQRRPETTS